MVSKGDNLVGNRANRGGRAPRRHADLRPPAGWRNACLKMDRMRGIASRLRVALGALALALGVCTACYTPSVPLPPPLVENMTFQAGPTAGTVVLKSPAQAQIGAVRFSVFNESQGVGVIVVSANDGSFTTPPFAGADGDYVEISYARGTDSAAQCTTLHVGVALVGATCH
jgi:hypothetical protein